MVISKDLFLAILAMDSYNRGYLPGVVLPGSAATGIGNATLRTDAQPQDYEAASFFAQAYTLTGSYADASGGPGLSAGQTVIS
ncbi:MAG TPA: hypothetical protein PLQ11_00780 [Beijerinckiaceae bacterium]|nr:hypothetical protein [Beijerinckiaceae bacterium]